MGSDPPIAHDPQWPVVSLREITTKIGSGATPKGGSDAYLPDRTNYALIRSQNVFDRRFDSDGLAFITDEQAAELHGVILQPADILLNITGDGVTFGRACMVPPAILPACVNQHVSIVRVDPRRADAGYVLAFLTHPDVKPYIESFNAGGSRRAITKGHIESFRVPLPPLPLQRKIANTLGILDDKIELNRRMSQTLESMARALFKSWFIDFDPVRAKTEGRQTGLPSIYDGLFPSRFQGSELGEIPEGWRVADLGELIELAYGKALRSEDRRPGSVAVFGSNGQIGWHDRPLVKGPGVIVGRKGNPGTVVWAAGDFFAIDTTFYVVARSPGLGPRFLYHALTEHDLAALGADSAVPGLNRSLAYMSRQLLPGRSVLAAFERLCAPVVERCATADRQRQALAQTRDALLVDLMSGSALNSFRSNTTSEG